MKITESVELLYLSLLLRWERNAPQDQHQGLLDGVPERNTQISRLIYIMRKIAAGSVDRTFRIMAIHTRKNDGGSYISKDESHMTDPRELDRGWYFEGCTSLKQKQDIIQSLSKVGIFPTFIACVDDFVAGKSVEKYVPSDEEQDRLIEMWDRDQESDLTMT